MFSNNNMDNQFQNQNMNDTNFNNQAFSNNMNNTNMVEVNSMKQYAMNSFVPLVPVTVNKDYITTMTIFSAIVIMMSSSAENYTRTLVLGFLAIVGYNLYCVAKMKRCGIKLTMAGSILTDAIIFCVCCLIFILIFKWNIGITVVKITWWCIECAIAQIITSIILDSEDKRKLKKLKDMEKQRKRYERKINKIYGKK